jgi:hypothetical protein
VSSWFREFFCANNVHVEGDVLGHVFEAHAEAEDCGVCGEDLVKEEGRRRVHGVGGRGILPWVRWKRIASIRSGVPEKRMKQVKTPRTNRQLDRSRSFMGVLWFMEKSIKKARNPGDSMPF